MKNEPAFPGRNPCVRKPGQPKSAYFAGITVRDYFAAKAMQAYTTHPDLLAANENTVAEWSYKMADAMLKAREET